MDKMFSTDWEVDITVGITSKTKQPQQINHTRMIGGPKLL
jgi:hypothetical protein